MSLPCVSVIILNFNGAEHLPICLESLLAQTYPHLEIIVADNGSSDDSAAICAAFERVNFVPLGRNYGFGLGNNLGARQARGEYLFFVNNDMRFAPDLVEMLVSTAEPIPNLFALDCKQYNWDGTQAIHTATRFCSAPLGASFVPFVDQRQVDVAEIVPVPFANGANLFCYKERFDRLGGFDPTFFFSWEDVDLCWRAWLLGWQTLHVPQAVCWHKVGATSNRPIATDRERSAWDEKSFRNPHHNHFRFTMKTMSMGKNVNVLIWLVVSIAGYLKQGHHTRAKLLTLAYWDCLKEWREIVYQRREALAGRHTASKTLIARFLT